MTTKADYTDEEWMALEQAPFAAGMYVVTTSPSGPIGVIQEVTAMATTIRNAATAQGDNQLVTILAQELMSKEGKEHAKPDTKDRPGMLVIVQAASAALARATEGEADGYRAWITTIAEKAAAAAREGGLFGIGHEHVSEAEKKAVDDVKTAIASPASAAG